jgi:hypothetical protein
MGDVGAALIGVAIGCLIVAVVCSLLMRPEAYCPDCFEPIKGWIWEGRDGGLLARWRRHAAESCEERAFQRAERRARLKASIGRLDRQD